MKLLPSNVRRHRAGFSLAEFSVAMSISVMVLGGVVYTHVAGQTLNLWTMTKVGAGNQAREAFFRLQDEIRSAKDVKIGEGTAIKFTPAADETPQQGTAIQIYPTSATNQYVRYFLHNASGNNELRRIEAGVKGYRTVASYLTNSVIFRAEDFRGNVLTETANNRAINVTLEFYQFQYPLTKVGNGYHYDFYKLQTKITRRNLE